MKISKIFHIFVACFLVLMFSCTVSAEGLSIKDDPSANLSSESAEDRLEILGNLNKQYTHLMSAVKESLDEMDESLDEMGKSLSDMDFVNEDQDDEASMEENNTVVQDFEQQFMIMKEELIKLYAVYEKFEEKLEDLQKSYNDLQLLSEEYKQLAVNLQEETSSERNVGVVFLIIVSFAVIVAWACIVWKLQPGFANNKKKPKDKNLPHNAPNRVAGQEVHRHKETNNSGNPQNYNSSYNPQSYNSSYNPQSYNSSFQEKKTVNVPAQQNPVPVGKSAEKPAYAESSHEMLKQESRAKSDTKQADKNQTAKQRWVQLYQTYNELMLQCYKTGQLDTTYGVWYEADPKSFGEIRNRLMGGQDATEVYRVVPVTSNKQYYQYILMHSNFLYPNFCSNAKTPNERFGLVLESARKNLMEVIFDFMDTNGNVVPSADVNAYSTVVRIEPALVIKYGDGSAHIKMRGRIVFR